MKNLCAVRVRQCNVMHIGLCREAQPGCRARSFHGHWSPVTFGQFQSTTTDSEESKPGTGVPTSFHVAIDSPHTCSGVSCLVLYTPRALLFLVERHHVRTLQSSAYKVQQNQLNFYINRKRTGEQSM